MENQQIPQDSPLDNFFNVAFDESTRAQVRQAAQWAKICALCAFIGYGLALIVAMFGQATVVQNENLRVSGFGRAGNIFGGLISAAIGTCINYFLYRFADSTVAGMDAMDGIKTNMGFNNLRIYFKVCGILLIIVLSLAGLFILFAIIGLGLARR